MSGRETHSHVREAKDGSSVGSPFCFDKAFKSRVNTCVPGLVSQFEHVEEAFLRASSQDILGVA